MHEASDTILPRHLELFFSFQTDIKDQSFRAFLQNVRQVENAAFELSKKEGTYA